MEKRNIRAGLVRANRQTVLSDGHEKRSRWAYLTLAFIALWMLGSGQSQAATYVYDGNGRLVAVTRDDGSSARYIYDVVGNLQQVVAVPAGQLSLFSFTPNHGSPGQVVTIAGQGFSATAANNMVTFHGVAATVTEATATTLEAVVPATATTGPIAVSADNQTATSIDPFVVDSTGLPPVIASFSPTTAHAGTAITLNGQHLYPVAGKTHVTANDQAVMPTMITDAEVIFPVPPSAGSGAISVETPYGLATSGTDLIVAPSDVDPADIVTSQRIHVGDTATLSIPGIDKYGALLFSAAQGDWLSFQLNSITPKKGYVFYTVYGPQNRTVMSGEFSSTERSLHLPPLSATGTYSLYLQAGVANTALQVQLESATVLTLDAPSTSLTTTVASQSKRFVFPAAQGQTLALHIAEANTIPAGDSVRFALKAPSGGEISNSSVDGPDTINVSNLLQSGVYQIIVAPTGNDKQHVSFQVFTGSTGQLAVDGPTTSFATAVPGENTYLTFHASPGDNLELALGNVATSDSNGYVSVDVLDGSGSHVISQSCDTSSQGSSCNMHLWNLAGGDYSAVIQPDETTATMQFAATLTRDGVGTLATGVPVSLTLQRPGQVERLNFAGAAHQQATITISGLQTTPANACVSFAITGPDGSALDAWDVCGDDAETLPAFPASGMYQLLVAPDNGAPTQMSLLLN